MGEESMAMHAVTVKRKKEAIVWRLEHQRV
jgi:hypothetical protein